MHARDGGHGRLDPRGTPRDLVIAQRPIALDRRRRDRLHQSAQRRLAPAPRIELLIVDDNQRSMDRTRPGRTAPITRARATPAPLLHGQTHRRVRASFATNQRFPTGADATLFPWMP